MLGKNNFFKYFAEEILSYLQKLFLVEKIIKLVTKKNLLEVLKYGIVTLVSYGVLFIGTFLLVEKINFPPNIAYFVLITLIYVGVYISYTKFVFREGFKKTILKRFVVALIGIWVMNNLFFNLIHNILGVQYMITLILNTIILGAIRFTIQKLYVFKS